VNAQHNKLQKRDHGSNALTVASNCCKYRRRGLGNNGPVYHAQQLHTFVEMIAMLSEISEVQNLGQSNLIFGNTLSSFQHSVGKMERSLPTKKQLDLSSLFDTTLACDRHRQT